MSNPTAEPVSACAPLDSLKRTADGLCSALFGLAGIVRSGTELPVGDDRKRIARLLVCWRRDALPDLESRLAEFDAALTAIQKDVIEARGGEPFELAWRKGDSAFDVLRELSRDVIARFHNCSMAVEVGSRRFCDQLESSIRLTRAEIEALKDAINRDFAFTRQQLRRIPLNTTPQPSPGDATPAARSRPAPRPKRSTQKGEGLDNLVGQLTLHHEYANGGCLNLEPINNNELARRAGVSTSTASTFFKKKFKGYARDRIVCNDAALLTAALKLLNDDYATHHLYGRLPHDRERDEE